MLVIHFVVVVAHYTTEEAQNDKNDNYQGRGKRSTKPAPLVDHLAFFITLVEEVVCVIIPKSNVVTNLE